VLLSTTNPADVGLDASIQSGGDLLVVNLTDFDPGQTVRFRIDIGSDDPGGFPHPDFRRVLFDMNGNNPADNAEVELQFSNGITTRLEQQLPDFAVAGPIFFESLVRPKAAMEPVGVFTITNRQVIPEPSTWLVATLVASIAAVCAGRTSGMAQEGQR
jgi:hypothetical protein